MRMENGSVVWLLFSPSNINPMIVPLVVKKIEHNNQIILINE